VVSVAITVWSQSRKIALIRKSRSYRGGNAVQPTQKTFQCSRFIVDRPHSESMATILWQRQEQYRMGLKTANTSKIQLDILRKGHYLVIQVLNGFHQASWIITGIIYDKLQFLKQYQQVTTNTTSESRA